MERIRRALELARAEREAIRRAGGTPNRPVPDMVPMLVDTPIAQESSANEPFRNTLELTPNIEAIRRNRLLEPGLVGVAGEGFRMLRTQVTQRMQQRGWNTLAVLAATAGDGATTVALNLAMAISADPKRSALLVDYVLTIAISIAAGVDALFSLLPPGAQAYTFTADIILGLVLIILNLRGMKESIKILLPVLQGARENPPKPPEVFRYTLSRGGQSWIEDRCEAVDLWAERQFVACWVDPRGNVMTMARIRKTLPPALLGVQVTRDAFDRAIADAAFDVLPESDDAVVAAESLARSARAPAPTRCDETVLSGGRGEA